MIAKRIQTRQLVEYGTPGWVIAYYPQNPLLDRFFENIKNDLNSHSKIKVKIEGFSDYSNFTISVDGRNLFVGVEFDEEYKDIKEFPKNFRFSLLFPSELRSEEYNPRVNNWQTNAKFPNDLLTSPRGTNSSYGGSQASYILEGFVTMQYCISTQFIREVLKAQGIRSHTNYQDMNLSLVRFADPPFYKDNYLDKTAHLIISLIPLAYLSIFVRNILLIVEEKER